MLTGTMVTVAAFVPIGFARSNAGEYTFSIFAVVGIALIACGMGRHDQDSIDQLIAPAFVEAGAVEFRGGEQQSGRSRAQPKAADGGSRC